MVDLDKQFAAMADVSEEDTAYDFVIDEDLRCLLYTSDAADE